MTLTYRDRYGDQRVAVLTDEVGSEGLWEGVYYTAVDKRSGLAVSLLWDAGEGWSEGRS